MCELCGGGDSVGVLRVWRCLTRYVMGGGVCFGALYLDILGPWLVSAWFMALGGRAGIIEASKIDIFFNDPAKARLLFR